MLDGETVRTNFALTHGFASGWSLGIEVPYYHVGGGVLDDVIDGWHSAFGMPDGGRNARPEGQLLYRFGELPSPSFELTEPQSGIGDTQLKFARLIGARSGIRRASERQAADRRGGHAGRQRVDRLVADGVAHAAAARAATRGGVLLGRRVRARRRSAADRLRIRDVGADRRRRRKLASRCRSGASKGSSTCTARSTSRRSRRSARPRSRRPLSAWRRMGQRGQIEFAVVEDLNVSTAPDVVLQVAAAWQW